MSDPVEDPHLRAGSEPTAGGDPAPEAPQPTSWTTEHYGFAGPPTPPFADQPAAQPSTQLPGHDARPATVAKPWWNRGRTLAAAGVAAAVFAVGAVGFTVGHAAANGPDGGARTSDVGSGPGGPGGRDSGR